METTLSLLLKGDSSVAVKAVDELTAALERMGAASGGLGELAKAVKSQGEKVEKEVKAAGTKKKTEEEKQLLADREISRQRVAIAEQEFAQTKVGIEKLRAIVEAEMVNTRLTETRKEQLAKRWQALTKQSQESELSDKAEFNAELVILDEKKLASEKVANAKAEKLSKERLAKKRKANDDALALEMSFRAELRQDYDRQIAALQHFYDDQSNLKSKRIAALKQVNALEARLAAESARATKANLQDELVIHEIAYAKDKANRADLIAAHRAFAANQEATAKEVLASVKRYSALESQAASEGLNDQLRIMEREVAAGRQHRTTLATLLKQIADDKNRSLEDRAAAAKKARTIDDAEDASAKAATAEVKRSASERRAAEKRLISDHIAQISEQRNLDKITRTEAITQYQALLAAAGNYYLQRNTISAKIKALLREEAAANKAPAAPRAPGTPAPARVINQQRVALEARAQAYQAQSQFGTSMKQHGSALTYGATVPVIGGIGYGAREYGQFETKQGEIASAVQLGGDSSLRGKPLRDALNKQILGLSTSSIGLPIEEVQALALQGAQAGVAQKNLAEYIETLYKLKLLIPEIGTEELAEKFNKLMVSSGHDLTMSAEKMMIEVGQLATVGAMSAAGGRQVLLASSQITGSLANVGGSTTLAYAMAASGTGSGLQVESYSTQINKLNTVILRAKESFKEGKGGDSALEMLSALVYGGKGDINQQKKFLKDLATDADTTLLKIVNSLRNVQQAKGGTVGIIDKLGIAGSRGVRSWFTLGNQKEDKTTQSMYDAAKAVDTKSVGAIIDERKAEQVRQFTIVVNKLREAMIQLAIGIIPAAGDIIGMIKDFSAVVVELSHKFSEFPEDTRRGILRGLLAFAAIGPILIGLGTGITVLTGLSTAIARYRLAIMALEGSSVVAAGAGGLGAAGVLGKLNTALRALPASIAITIGIAGLVGLDELIHKLGVTKGFTINPFKTIGMGLEAYGAGQEAKAAADRANASPLAKQMNAQRELSELERDYSINKGSVTYTPGGKAGLDPAEYSRKKSGLQKDITRYTQEISTNNNLARTSVFGKKNGQDFLSTGIIMGPGAHGSVLDKGAKLALSGVLSQLGSGTVFKGGSGNSFTIGGTDEEIARAAFMAGKKMPGFVVSSKSVKAGETRITVSPGPSKQKVTPTPDSSKNTGAGREVKDSAQAGVNNAQAAFANAQEAVAQAYSDIEFNFSDTGTLPSAAVKKRLLGLIGAQGSARVGLARATATRQAASGVDKNGQQLNPKSAGSYITAQVAIASKANAAANLEYRKKMEAFDNEELDTKKESIKAAQASLQEELKAVKLKAAGALTLEEKNANIREAFGLERKIAEKGLWIDQLDAKKSKNKIAEGIAGSSYTNTLAGLSLAEKAELDGAYNDEIGEQVKALELRRKKYAEDEPEFEKLSSEIQSLTRSLRNRSKNEIEATEESFAYSQAQKAANAQLQAKAMLEAQAGEFDVSQSAWLTNRQAARRAGALAIEPDSGLVDAIMADPSNQRGLIGLSDRSTELSTYMWQANTQDAEDRLAVALSRISDSVDAFSFTLGGDAGFGTTFRNAAIAADELSPQDSAKDKTIKALAAMLGEGYQASIGLNGENGSLNTSAYVGMMSSLRGLAPSSKGANDINDSMGQALKQKLGVDMGGASDTRRSLRGQAIDSVEKYFTSLPEWAGLPKQLRDEFTKTFADARKALKDPGRMAVRRAEGEIYGTINSTGKSILDTYLNSPMPRSLGVGYGPNADRVSSSHDEQWKGFWNAGTKSIRTSISNGLWDKAVQPELDRFTDKFSARLGTFFGKWQGSIAQFGLYAGVLANALGAGGRNSQRNTILGTIIGFAAGSLIPGLGNMAGASIGGAVGSGSSNGGGVTGGILAGAGAIGALSMNNTGSKGGAMSRAARVGGTQVSIVQHIKNEDRGSADFYNEGMVGRLERVLVTGS